MAKYYVQVPMSGVISVEVEAENEEEAIKNALESEQLTLDNLVEWEATEYLVRGNVFAGMLSEAYAEED